MEQYTILCTESQTRKALGLGASLEYTYGDCGIRHYINPTAEQMIGWLEEQHIDCFVGKQSYARFVATVCVNEGLIYSNPCCNSRREATLAAIDAALEYLIKNKK